VNNNGHRLSDIIRCDLQLGRVLVDNQTEAIVNNTSMENIWLIDKRFPVVNNRLVCLTKAPSRVHDKNSKGECLTYLRGYPALSNLLFLL